MNILELFSGTHSIGKVFAGENIISVDLDPKFNPTHLVDILTFDYKQYPADYFNYIHASPPCILYSQTQVSWYNRNKRHNITGEMVLWNRELHEECIYESDKLVLKVLEILEYFKPKYWTIENPYHHNWCSIHKRTFMKDKPYTLVNYCMYEYPIKKPTIIFNNFGLKLNVCDKSHKHMSFRNFSGNIYERYVIPNKLCLEIKNAILSY
jgi:hypothetical protein